MNSHLDLIEEARGLLPEGVFQYVATGAGVEETLESAPAAWRRYLLRPRLPRNVTTVDVTTSVLGTPVTSPVQIAPTGFQRIVHADGEVGTAKAAAEAGSLLVLSSRATSSLEEIQAVAGPWWLQAYVLRDRELTAEIVRRAAAAGARALVLTVDTPHVARKARSYEFDTAVGTPLIPELATRDDLGVWQAPDVTLADVHWLAELSAGVPVVVKGILRGDDARECVAAGASAVWVSNHGGRQLDGAIPSALALPEVVDAVGDTAEVYVDGGIRSGRDVVRALALGARAAFVGRPVVWALAVAGTDGVRELLDGFREDVEETMSLTGCTSVAEIGPDLVTLP
jgi:4-hydroxymandelate oxidase